MGYDVPKHKSIGITKELVDWTDKIYCMDNANLKRMKKGFPELDKPVEVIGVQDPHFKEGIAYHKLAAIQLEVYIKKYLCAE